MAFDVRCPSCKAKMRFDAPPKRGEEIECPKCGQAFPAPSAAAFEQKKSDADKKPGGEKKAKKVKTVEAVPRTYFNHWLLLLIVGGLMFTVITTLSIIWVIVARAAKGEDMLACVPENFNVLRGVNVKAMRNYPGVKANADRYYDAQAQGVFAHAADQLGLDKDTDLAYFICAREAGTSAVLFLFGTVPEFDPEDLGGGEVTNLNYAGLPSAKVVCPTRWLVAVAFGAGGRETSLLNTVAENARSKPWEGMHTEVGTTGKLAIRGQIWTIYRAEGSLKDWLKSSAEAIKEDGSLTKLRESMGKASVLATWVSFGTSGVRFGAGLELPESSDASELVDDMKKGPMGKADESEPPNNFKQALSQVADVKRNGAFYQYLEYKKQGTCAFIMSKVEDPEKASGPLGEFIHTSRGAGPSGGGGFR